MIAPCGPLATMGSKESPTYLESWALNFDIASAIVVCTSVVKRQKPSHAAHKVIASKQLTSVSALGKSKSFVASDE